MYKHQSTLLFLDKAEWKKPNIVDQRPKIEICASDSIALCVSKLILRADWKRSEITSILFSFFFYSLLLSVSRLSNLPLRTTGEITGHSNVRSALLPLINRMWFQTFQSVQNNIYVVEVYFVLSNKKKTGHYYLFVYKLNSITVLI